METVIEVAPLEWAEWQIHGSEEYTDRGTGRTYPNTRMYTDSNNHPLTYHKLIELGRTTNTYQYKVYRLGRVLLYETIRPPCCSTLKYCPLGRYGEPPMMELCREHLRVQAMEEAYQLWVEFMRKLGGRVE